MTIPKFGPPKPTDPSVDRYQSARNRRPEAPRSKKRKSFDFKSVSKPTVATYVARLVILNHMDFERAVDELDPALDESKRNGLAWELSQNKSVREAVEKQLSAKGLDDKAKEIFVEEIWNRFWNGTDKEKEVATRTLAKAFIADNLNVNRPEELPIKDFADGIRMLKGDSADAGAETNLD